MLIGRPLHNAGTPMLTDVCCGFGSTTMRIVFPGPLDETMRAPYPDGVDCGPYAI